MYNHERDRRTTHDVMGRVMHSVARQNVRDGFIYSTGRRAAAAAAAAHLIMIHLSDVMKLHIA